jgi:hypothetical protein
LILTVTMVLNPLTAFSVAGTVVQFVDFSLKIFAKTRQIYRSAEGATKINQHLADTAQDLRNLVTKLQRPLVLKETSTTSVTMSNGCRTSVLPARRLPKA